MVYADFIFARLLLRVVDNILSSKSLIEWKYNKNQSTILFCFIQNLLFLENIVAIWPYLDNTT